MRGNLHHLFMSLLLMGNFMGLLGWATAPRYLVNIILDISVKVILGEINIHVSGL